MKWLRTYWVYCVAPRRTGSGRGNKIKKVVVTGANGFIGAALADSLRAKGYEVSGTVRDAAEVDGSGVRLVSVGDIGPDTDWHDALLNQDIVVHTAARVHRMVEAGEDVLSEYRYVNTLGTATLAQQAASMGIKRFVFLSSIKVNGEFTVIGGPFKAEDVPAPMDPYGISKSEAETELFRVSAATGMEVVVVRPPLVYGPGVKANFRSMMAWLNKGIPLPLGAIRNKRSMIALGNLIDFLSLCLEHPAAANQVFLASDGEDLSTTDLLKRLGKALNRRPILLPVPEALLTLCATMAGKASVAHKLCRSLQVDIEKNKTLLGWVPPVSVDSALRSTVFDFINKKLD